jgi:plastocyanin
MRTSGSMRTGGTRAAGIGTLILALLLAGAGTAVASGWLERSTGVPPPRTVRIRIHFSRFDAQEIDVEPGQTIRFVVENTDPIDHEFILGDEEVQRVHEVGSEAHHAPRPGEISIPAGETVVTTYTFPERTGGLIFGCHLPGHYAYGMRGVIWIA